MDTIDVSFVGSGIAATLTLIEIFDKLLKSPPAAHKLTIAIIEKYPEFWKGIPYGKRSSVNALTITTVHDFIYENERPVFFEWLKANKNDWATYYREHGGATAARWLENNLPLIENNAWETVYIPRFIFGNYLQEKLLTLLKDAEEKQLATIKLIHAEAIDIKVLDNDLHEIILEHPDMSLSTVISRKVVIAAGSAPVRKMYAATDRNVLYINDIYDPSVENNLKKLHAALNQTEDPANRNILVIGSNASSIELLYLLEGMPELRKMINKTVIISSSGALPLHISTEKLPEHPIPNLDKVKAVGNYTIETLVDAAAMDLKYALQNGANMDYVATIISNTLVLMESLDETAKKAFFAIHGIRLRDMFRRSGPEYKNCSQLLIDLEEVIILKGRFLNTQLAQNGVLLNYKHATGTREMVYSLSFKAIINCSGSDNLNNCDSRLLYNLTNKNICKMNLSGKGFEVNEKFEAASNIYVIGPLLGGNMNKLIHFWQLENASRLTSLAPLLADELLSTNNENSHS